jgi:Holliday junction resolvase
MSKMQRDKGKRFEREVVNTLKESGFFGAKEYRYLAYKRVLKEMF